MGTEGIAGGGAPKAQAIQLSKLLTQVFGADRFPVDVQSLALEYSKQRFPDSHIARIERLDAAGFEGCLKANADRSRWLIAYSAVHSSPGRVRFTLAHEFGHYLLHRARQPVFECTERDIYDWDSPSRNMEAEADTFASYLLMPLDDFRAQLGKNEISLEFLEHCRSRYGVSRMAAALKWIEIAPRRALVVVARDGFLLWARANKAAFRSGAFLATRKSVIEVPKGSLIAEVDAGSVRSHAVTRARLWFPREPNSVTVTELAMRVDGPYPYVLGILVLPEAEKPWERIDADNDDLGD
jgi:Zn-dependent peptidase ImmA (M78 family)